MEKKLKHLDFLQLTITRMNVNSFLVKGWAVTIVAALCALSATKGQPAFAGITFAVVLIFWILDGYYLSLERQYRKLYDEVRTKSEDAIDFNMNASEYNHGTCSWLHSIFAFTLCFFYFTVCCLTIIAVIILN